MKKDSRVSVKDDVTIIVVTYNSEHCIEGLAETLEEIGNIVVVDNGSNDDSVRVSKLLIPNAEVISLKDNLGFGAANNVALRKVKTRYALLLNPDCSFEMVDFLELFERSMALGVFGIVGPGLTKVVLPRESARAEYVSVDFICGAAMLVDMKAAKTVNYFDEDFFLYYEDDDLCKRMLDAGYPLYQFTNIVFPHESRGSVGGRRPERSEYIRGYHHAQSKVLFMDKHGSPGEARYLRWKTLILAVLLFPFRFVLYSKKHVFRLRGRIDGLLEYVHLEERV